jgi:hypothetical protein
MSTIKVELTRTIQDLLLQQRDPVDALRFFEKLNLKPKHPSGGSVEHNNQQVYIYMKYYSTCSI